MSYFINNKNYSKNYFLPVLRNAKCKILSVREPGILLFF